MSLYVYVFHVVAIFCLNIIAADAVAAVSVAHFAKEKRTFHVFHVQVHFIRNFLFLVESVDVLARQFLEHIQNL